MAAEKKVDTVTLKDLAASLAGTHSLPKAQANTMLTEMVANVGKHLKKGSRIRIPGLGILQVRKRAAQMGRNPATGEAIKIKASKKIAFRADTSAKGALPVEEWDGRGGTWRRWRAGPDDEANAKDNNRNASRGHDGPYAPRR